MKTQYKYQSEVGPLYITANENALCGIFWKKQNIGTISDPKDHLIILKTIKELEEFFSGKRKEFTVALELEGTPFQKSVWKELLKIPYGKTCSYQDLAKKLKNDKAFRAVGTANGKNPISIIVPCHRVITSSGTLGGYAGGLKIKEKLLALEKALI